MPQDIFDQLKTQRTEQLQQILKLGSEYERLDLVFANEFRRPLDLKNLRTRNFARILKAVGICEKFRVYDLRHSMATLMLSNGENPKVVSERLGHASVTLTMDVYSHVLPDIQREATDRLGKVLFGRTPRGLWIRNRKAVESRRRDSVEGFQLRVDTSVVQVPRKQLAIHEADTLVRNPRATMANGQLFGDPRKKQADCLPRFH